MEVINKIKMAAPQKRDPLRKNYFKKIQEAADFNLSKQEEYWRKSQSDCKKKSNFSQSKAQGHDFSCVQQ